MSLSLQSILGTEALAAFEAPGPVASGLPAAAYTSEAFFALENERLFSPSWVRYTVEGKCRLVRPQDPGCPAPRPTPRCSTTMSSRLASACCVPWKTHTPRLNTKK